MLHIRSNTTVINVKNDTNNLQNIWNIIILLNKSNVGGKFYSFLILNFKNISAFYQNIVKSHSRFTFHCINSYPYELLNKLGGRLIGLANHFFFLSWEVVLQMYCYNSLQLSIPSGIVYNFFILVLLSAKCQVLFCHFHNKYNFL